MSKKYILAIIGILIVVGGIVWLFASGRLVWADSGAAKTARVCGSDIVNKYNDAMYMIGRNGSTEASIDENGVKQVQSEVKGKTGYENDATCQTLLFWIAIHDNDYPAARAAATAVKQLHDKDVFADNNIRGNDPILTYDTVLYGISPEAKEKAGAS